MASIFKTRLKVHMNETSKISIPYKALCTEYYELDKPTAPLDALSYYLKYAEEVKGSILEPMCGTGRYLIPFLEKGYAITGFDSSPHMLDICRKKCQERNLECAVLEASFESISIQKNYQLIFIPSSSFCLLTTERQINQALNWIVNHLNIGGKFVFEIETLHAVGEPQGIWQANWINKSDQAKLVLNRVSRFDPLSKIETILCRYELWEANHIVQTEVEDFRLKLYEISEIEQLLEEHGLTVVGKWQPYTQEKAHQNSPVILYECLKS